MGHFLGSNQLKFEILKNKTLSFIIIVISIPTLLEMLKITTLFVVANFYSGSGMLIGSIDLFLVPIFKSQI